MTSKPGEKTEIAFVTALAVVGVIQVAYLGIRKVVRTLFR